MASKGLAAAKGPLHAIRGTGEAEKMLKNAKTEFFNEFEEIATYTAIETLAEAVGDKDTAKLAKAIRREEERMAKFLERQIPALAKAVATEEIPAAERRRSHPPALGSEPQRRQPTHGTRQAGAARAARHHRSQGARTQDRRASAKAPLAAARAASRAVRCPPRGHGRVVSRHRERAPRQRP